jgi:hypothetical protein
LNKEKLESDSNLSQDELDKDEFTRHESAPILDYHNPIYTYNQYYKYTPIDSKEFDNEIIDIEFTLLEWLQELRNIGVLNRKNIPLSKRKKIK